MRIAESLAYPFRRGALGVWLVGMALLVLFPATFWLVLGYGIDAIRQSAADPGAPPPRFHLDFRTAREGALASLAALALALPYVLLSALLASLIAPAFIGLSAPFGRIEATLVAGLLVALPWGTLVLVLAPPAFAAFAASGRAGDLFDARAAARTVRTRFVDWNLATVVIVTAWLIALAGLGLCCVGVIPGVMYAILVSAHADASLCPQTQTAAEAASAG